MRFLSAAGIPQTNLSFRVYIHESADIASAQRFWTEVTGHPPSRFRAPVIKHHNPRTVRKNVGEDYHGCLRIDVHQSADLYHKIEGWAAASMAEGHSASESA